MIVFGIQCNFFIVLPNRLKTCRLIDLFFYVRLSALYRHRVRNCPDLPKTNKRELSIKTTKLPFLENTKQTSILLYATGETHEFNVKQKNVKGRTFAHWTEKNNDLLKTLLLKN